MTVTLQTIASAIHDLNLAGQCLCIHASLRSFGPVAGGARTIIHGFLAENCTVMVPTHSYCYHMREGHPPPSLYSPESNTLDLQNMGVIPATLLNMEGRVRGNHPLDSFTALGPRAPELIKGQGFEDVYAPVRALVDLGGYVLLMGVGLDKMTALHQAEKMTGRELDRLPVMGPEGRPVWANVGACSNGFPRLDGVLAPIEGRVRVGESLWRLFPAGLLLELAARAIRADPMSTHCGDPDCDQCNQTAALSERNTV